MVITGDGGSGIASGETRPARPESLLNTSRIGPEFIFFECFQNRTVIRKSLAIANFLSLWKGSLTHELALSSSALGNDGH